MSMYNSEVFLRHVYRLFNGSILSLFFVCVLPVTVLSSAILCVVCIGIEGLIGPSVIFTVLVNIFSGLVGFLVGYQLSTRFLEYRKEIDEEDGEDLIGDSWKIKK